MQFMCLAALLRPMSYYEELHSAELKECNSLADKPAPAIVLTDDLGEEKIMLKTKSDSYQDVQATTNAYNEV